MNYNDTEVDSEEALKIEMLNDFAMSLSRKRTEAIEFRKSSGIESVWSEDREYYHAIDDANRKEVWIKPTTMDGVLTSEYRGGDHQGANVFIGLTQFYVDGCAARIIDMLTPNSDKPFEFKPSPKSQTLKDVMNKLHGATNGVMEQPQGLQQAGMPPIQQADPMMAMQGQADPMQMGGMPNQMQADPMAMMQPPSMEQIEKQALAIVGEAAKKAETQIWDWLEESSWHRELREVIQDMACIGTGIIKGPVPYKSISKQTQKTELGIDFISVEEVKPGSFFVKAENIYPDPACGNDPHNGAYIWERGDITARQLKQLKGLGYIDSQIDLVIEEGPGKKYVNDKSLKKSETDKFEIWYYHGYADKEDMLAAGVEVKGVTPCVVVMVNDRVIKASINVLDTGRFPYDFLIWQPLDNSPWGKGVARLVRNEQKMLNAFVRNMCDNIALAAGPQIVFKRGIIEPVDGKWDIHRLKLWQADSFQTAESIQHSIMSLPIPVMMNEIMEAIKFTLEMAEKVTAMPLMMQGDQGVNPETASGRLILQNNASTVLRRIAKMFDDRIIPHLDRYYEWLMMYSEDEECKGDFQIQALGSSALYERDASNQAVLQMGQLVMNPAFGVDPAKWMVEFLKIQKIDPDRMMLTDEQKQQAAQAAQQQKDPRIEAQLQIAQIKTQGDMAKAQLNQTSDMQELKLREEIATTTLQTKMDEAELQREHERQMMQMKYQMELMQFTKEQGLTLEQTKAKLAETAIKLKTQKDLSQQAMEIDLAKHGKQIEHETNVNDSKTAADLYKHDNQVSNPPTEPQGRASAGMSYAQ